MKNGYEEKKKGNLKNSIIIVILILIAGIAISYAIWLSFDHQENENYIGTSCLDIDLVGIDDIYLPNASPILESDGQLLEPYQFTITNNCDSEANVKINLEILNRTDLPDYSDYIRVSMDGMPSKTLSEYSSEETNLDDAIDSYNLLDENLSNSKTYELRLWLDADTPVERQYMEKTFVSKIFVKGTSLE